MAYIKNKDASSKLKARGQVIMVKKVSKDFAPIVDAMVDAAKGMYVEKEVQEYDMHRHKTGNVVRRVYQEKPDTSMGQYLINQIAGKPKETMEVKGRVNLIMDDEK